MVLSSQINTEVVSVNRERNQVKGLYHEQACLLSPSQTRNWRTGGAALVVGREETQAARSRVGQATQERLCLCAHESMKR